MPTFARASCIAGNRRQALYVFLPTADLLLVGRYFILLDYGSFL